MHRFPILQKQAPRALSVPNPLQSSDMRCATKRVFRHLAVKSELLLILF